MNKDLVLISHNIGKKRLPIKAEVSPISSIGQFVTTHYTPITRTSLRRRFTTTFLKCFGKYENSPDGFNNTDWTIQFIGNERNDRQMSSNGYSNNFDQIASTTIVASSKNPQEQKYSSSWRDAKLFNNYHHTVSFKIPSNSSVPEYEHKEHLESPRNSKDQLKKYPFRVWLSKRDGNFDCLEAELASKEILTEIAERTAKMALVRSKSKAALRAGAVIAAAYARVNSLGCHIRVSNDAAIGVINQACREKLNVSPISNDKGADHHRLLQLCHSEIDSIQPQNYDYQGLSKSKNESKGLTNRTTVSEMESSSAPENIKIGKEGSMKFPYPRSEDLQSRSLSESSESSSFDDEECPFSAGTRNWLKLLMSNTDFLGKDLSTTQILGDEFSDNCIEIDDNSQVRYDRPETSSPETRGLNVGTNPCMLDDSWIEVFLSQINEDSFHSFHENSDEIKSVMSPDILVAIQDFRIYLHSDPSDDKSISGSKFEAEDKVATGYSDSHRNILGSLSSEGTDSQEDTSSSQEDISCCTDFDDYLMDFSKAYLRIEALDSQFKQITCQVDRIVSAILRDDICDELSLETHQTVSEVEWDEASKISGISWENKSDSAVLGPDEQVKESFLQIDATLPVDERESVEAFRKEEGNILW